MVLRPPIWYSCPSCYVTPPHSHMVLQPLYGAPPTPLWYSILYSIPSSYGTTPPLPYGTQPLSLCYSAPSPYGTEFPLYGTLIPSSYGTRSPYSTPSLLTIVLYPFLLLWYSPLLFTTPLYVSSTPLPTVYSTSPFCTQPPLWYFTLSLWYSTPSLLLWYSILYSNPSMLVHLSPLPHC